MLGLLIYIIYVNDVLRVANGNTKVVMYADDMLIISQNSVKPNMESELQSSLNDIIPWCNY